jgi:hypothetical protein
MDPCQIVNQLDEMVPLKLDLVMERGHGPFFEASDRVGVY